MFYRDLVDVSPESIILLFSVAKSEEDLGLANRVMVKFEGSDTGVGLWKCVRDGGACVHISAARKSMSGTFIQDEDDDQEIDDGDGCGSQEDVSE